MYCIVVVLISFSSLKSFISMPHMYYGFEHRILHAFLYGLPRRGREKGMTIINKQLIYEQEYPLSFYFMNVLCPGFTVLVPEWTCNKQCNCELALGRERLLACSGVEQVES